MYNNPKNPKTQNLTLIQDMVTFNGPTKSKLCLKISKEYFMHLTLYNFIFQIDKKLVNFRFFWNTLSSTLFMNTGLDVNTLTTNKACLYVNVSKLTYLMCLFSTITIKQSSLKHQTYLFLFLLI